MPFDEPAQGEGIARVAPVDQADITFRFDVLVLVSPRSRSPDPGGEQVFGRRDPENPVDPNGTPWLRE